ncbi:fibroblast growth factor receptor substrate 2 [Clupea harengus]|uniref:Fibroblast growth factor receptor substrate 2 n=1 Tax=Clupea harengus TaxID=7950 RepID=A0A6P8FKK2_CLUHA|nr:fibroblast growth factor receptor substrate 2 [Clupea harengus]XP_031424192.1 fibroblast growth factor receptor substrate 2 [Clupea harengus]
MGSCWSCLYRDSIQDNHPNRFKVTNVDDEGNELGSGTMELTQTELILHTRKRDAIRWPYLCLRRYGYDSNLFSFESGRRCQTGQGIFAFKCSRAEEVFNLLQELMQCNSINVVEEPMIMTRPAHTPEIDISRTPQTPNTPAFPVQGFPNGYPGYSISGDSSQPSLNDDHGHSLMGLDDQAHTYVNTVNVDGDLSSRHCVHSLPEVRPNSFQDSACGGPSTGPASMHCCGPLDDHKDPQVFLQPGSQEVKFMLGPTPAQRHLLERDQQRHAHQLPPHQLPPHVLRSSGGAETSSGTEGEEPPVHMCNSYHHYHHHLMHMHPEGCPVPPSQLTYENINGLRGSVSLAGRRQRLSPSSVSQSLGSSSSSSTGDMHPHSLPLVSHAHPSSASLPHTLPPQSYSCERGGHRRTALLNYENLPSLPPVWEYRALQRHEEEDDEEQDEEEEEEEEEYEEEEDEEDFDEYEFSEGPGTPNGYHQQEAGVHRDALQNYVNTDQMQIPMPPHHACVPHLPPHPQRPCQAERGGRVFGFPHLRRRSGGGGGARGGRGSCEHGHMPPTSRQLNYIQVDLEGDSSSACQGHGVGVGVGAAGVGPMAQRSLAHKRGMAAAAAASGPPPPRRSEFYAVIDLKKTVAMSNLQKALPRDDGTSRKTRHNSTDLPL